MTTKRASQQLDSLPRTLYAPTATTDDLTVYPVLITTHGAWKITPYAEDGLPLGVDSATGVLMNMNYEHHEIHSGSHYFISDDATLANNAVVDVQFQTPDTTKWIHFTFQVDAAATTEYFIYEDVTFTVTGSTLPSYNNDRNSANTSGTTRYIINNASLADANADTNLTGSTTLVHGYLTSGRAGGVVERSKEIILKQDTKYSMRAVALAAGTISFNIEWYEHTNK